MPDPKIQGKETIVWRDGISDNLNVVRLQSTKALLVGMEAWQVVAVNLMKANHVAASSLSKKAIRRHSHKRYYTRTGKLTESTRPGSTKFIGGQVVGEVLAGGPAADYAVYVELGTANSRAFPYMLPGMIQSHKTGMALMQAAMKNMGPIL